MSNLENCSYSELTIEIIEEESVLITNKWLASSLWGLSRITLLEIVNVFGLEYSEFLSIFDTSAIILFCSSGSEPNVFK